MQHETQNVEGNALIAHAACKRICLTTLKKVSITLINSFPVVFLLGQMRQPV